MKLLLVNAVPKANNVLDCLVGGRRPWTSPIWARCSRRPSGPFPGISLATFGAGGLEDGVWHGMVWYGTSTFLENSDVPLRLGLLPCRPYLWGTLSRPAPKRS